MTSLTRIAYGSFVRRHGRSRRARTYHRSSASRSPSRSELIRTPCLPGSPDARAYAPATSAPDPAPRSAAASFDFAGFRRALTTRDVPAWLAHFADDAEWIEHRPSDAPRPPERIRGRAAIARYLEEIAAEDLRLAIEDEVIGGDRIAFRIVCDLADGRRMVEHAIATIRDGRIVRMVEIEAWDLP